MAPTQPTDGVIVADKDEKVLRGVFVPHAVDAPLVAVSVPRASVSNDSNLSNDGEEPASEKEAHTGEMPPEVKDAFLSLISSAEVFPGDEVAVTSATSPFASRVELPIAIIYNEASKAPGNMRASRLTMALESGVVTKISGGALVLGCAAGGSDPTSRSNYSCYSSVLEADLGAMDNALHDEVMEYFCQGLVPRKEDLDRILAGFRAGGFRYDVVDEANEVDGVDGVDEAAAGDGLKETPEKSRKSGKNASTGKNSNKANKASNGKHDGKEQELPGWGGDGNWSD